MLYTPAYRLKIRYSQYNSEGIHHNKPGIVSHTLLGVVTYRGKSTKHLVSCRGTHVVQTSSITPPHSIQRFSIKYRQGVSRITGPWDNSFIDTKYIVNARPDVDERLGSLISYPPNTELKTN